MRTICETEFYKHTDDLFIFKDRMKKYGTNTGGQICEYFQNYIPTGEISLIMSKYKIRKIKSLIKKDNIKPKNMPQKDFNKSIKIQKEMCKYIKLRRIHK